MAAWNDFVTLFNGTLPSVSNLDWSPVDEMSDVSATRIGASAGIRYRSEEGYGLEISASLVDYNDNDPILEDETGSFNRFTVLASKAF